MKSRTQLADELALEVAAFRAARESGAESTDAHRITVCTYLCGLLASHADELESWDPHAWFDGVSPRIVEETSDGLEVRGFAIWVDARGQWWRDPFAAVIEVGLPSPTCYRMAFGDSAHGIGVVPVGAREETADPTTAIAGWAHVFRGP